MEFEHLPHYLLGDNLKTHNLHTNIASFLGGGGGGVGGFTGDDEDDIHDSGSHRIKSFDHFLEQKGTLPRSNDPTEKKLRWLRSQIIGGSAEFNTPFGRRLLTYADHTASGRSLHYIENYIKHNLLPFYGNSHTSDSYVGYRTTKMVHEAANYVKKCLGGGEDDPIMFCGSGSTAAIKRLQEVMGVAIPSILRERMLKCLRNEERWVVFVGPYEHHSNILSWRQSLAEVVEICLDHHGLIDMEELREKLEFYKARNRPILGSFSACSNVTGICPNTRAIAHLLHRFGGFVCFDFAASGPYKKIDMRSGRIDGYDAIFLSVHKFLGGPCSSGILLMNKALYQLGSSPPSTCGGGTVNFVNGYNAKDTIYLDNIEEREDAGTPPIIQKIRAALAFWIKEYIGYKAIKTKEKSYIKRALERLLPSQDIWVLGNTTAKRQAILSFLIYSTTYSTLENKRDDQQNKGLDLWRETGNMRGKPLHGPFTAKLLNDLFGIQARGGCACAGPYGHMLLNVDEPHSLAFRSVIQKGYAGIKPGWTRVSFPYYMSEEEFEFILTAIEFIAIYGQRFLPWYHFNWRTGSWTFKKDVLADNYNNVLNGIIKTLNMECNENQQNKKVDMSSKYTNYLETAKQIANLLPKFPPQRRIPEEIDIDLVPFRV
ncbi:Cysteine desulfurase [Handroanthus impetiginosus]|uniref:Cysteine desulfurase n=1 Tax=Handroanthus impetiginosus TaxID=429701 RepID=A0A2G9HTH6_9LAMI|nr:Cysteine desulfurase [Handroanthus impetiginosus]